MSRDAAEQDFSAVSALIAQIDAELKEVGFYDGWDPDSDEEDADYIDGYISGLLVAKELVEKAGPADLKAARGAWASVLMFIDSGTPLDGVKTIAESYVRGLDELVSKQGAPCDEPVKEPRSTGDSNGSAIGDCE